MKKINKISYWVALGVLFSHIAVGVPLSEFIPAVLLLIITVFTWRFGPAYRKLDLTEVSES